MAVSLINVLMTVVLFASAMIVMVFGIRADKRQGQNMKADREKQEKDEYQVVPVSVMRNKSEIARHKRIENQISELRKLIVKDIISSERKGLFYSKCMFSDRFFDEAIQTVMEEFVVMGYKISYKKGTIRYPNGNGLIIDVSWEEGSELELAKE